MSQTFYLGYTKAGEPVVRNSKNPNFTHAAVKPGYKHGDTPLPSFSTSPGGAAKNFATTFGKTTTPEVVEVVKVDRKVLEQAIDPERRQLVDVAGDHDIEVASDMSNTDIQAAIEAAEASVDTSVEDEFEAGAAEEAAKRQAIAAEAEAARIAEEDRIEREHPMARPEQAVTVSNVSLPKSGQDGKCPHCGKSTRDGDNVTEFAELSPGSQRDTDQKFTCNACAGEWGPKVDKPKAARAKSGSSNGLKIEKDRESRNGVTRPSAGGKCRGIWDMLDGMGLEVTAAQARKAGEGKYDRTTIMVQFYRWRKFNGIEGRQ